MSDASVVILGPAEALNGRVLTEVRKQLGNAYIRAVYMKYKEVKENAQKALVDYLLGLGGDAFEAASSTFQLTTGQNPNEIYGLVIDVSLLPEGAPESNKYTDLKEVFPNLKKVILCCNHNKVLKVVTL